MKVWIGTAFMLHAGLVLAIGQRGESLSFVAATAGPSQVDVEVVAPETPLRPDLAPVAERSRVNAGRVIPAPTRAALSPAVPSLGDPSDAVPDPIASTPLRFPLALATTASSHASSEQSGNGPAASVPEPATPATVSTPARLVSSLAPGYPLGARDDGVEADVRLEIVVDGSGRVVNARLLQHAGFGFDESALSAIHTYRFSPAMKDGKVVPVRMPWTVEFRLR